MHDDIVDTHDSVLDGTALFHAGHLSIESELTANTKQNDSMLSHTKAFMHGLTHYRNITIILDFESSEIGIYEIS